MFSGTQLRLNKLDLRPLIFDPYPLICLLNCRKGDRAEADLIAKFLQERTLLLTLYGKYCSPIEILLRRHESCL